MNNVGKYVIRVLSDRMAQPGKWHVVKEERRATSYRGANVVTLCNVMMMVRRENVRWNNTIGRYQPQAAHTLAFSDFPRNARTEDRDDTNLCRNCEFQLNANN